MQYTQAKEHFLLFTSKQVLFLLSIRAQSLQTADTTDLTPPAFMLLI